MRVSALSKSYFGQSTITELIGPIIPRPVYSAGDPARRVADPGLPWPWLRRSRVALHRQRVLAWRWGEIPLLFDLQQL